MSSNSVLNAVQHYQRGIEKNPTDVARLLHCVGKLYKIPITVEHLQQTGVGRTVNALRKHDGELGIAAEAVVNKWKQLVAAENDIRAGNQSSENEQDDDEEDDNNSEKNAQTNCNDTTKTQSNEHTLTNQYSHSANKTEKSKNDTETNKDTSKKQHKSTSSSSAHKNHDRHSHHKSEHRDKLKEHHSKDLHKRDEREHKSHKSHSKSEKKEKSEDIREKHSKSEHKSKTERSTTAIESSKKHISSKDKSEHHNSNGKHKHHEKHHSSKEKDKAKSKSNSNSEHKSQSTSPSRVKPSSIYSYTDEPTTSAAAITPQTPSPGKKRRHEEDEENANTPKKPKSNHKHHNEKQNKQNSDNNQGEMDDGIDSSMGANFEDVLGMLNMPKKKAKKSLNALKNTSPKSAKKTLESDNSKSSSTSMINGTCYTEMPSSSSTLTSQRKLEKKPDLLTSKAKLPPLDPSIALELPIISNNYKPLPLNPTVMDCVFNSTTSSSSRAPPPRLLSDAEALSHGISSKTMRTKVYSGVKTGQLMQVPTLFDLCIRVLQKNIDALEYTGGVPFDVLRPVLERATPQQLFTFEEYNPYLMEDSDVLWKQHVQRNYRAHKREEMESWREMFMRCQEDQDRRLSMLAENIKQSQKAIALPVRKTQLAFVDSMVKPPRNVVRKQEQYGTKSKLVATPAARVAALCNVTPNAAKQGDARLRVAAAFAQDPVKLANAPVRPKKAPLMAKTLQFMRGRLKR